MYVNKNKHEEEKNIMEENKEFPIMGDYCSRVGTIPWEILQPHEEQAYKNHSQSLKRLAERGGLSFSEAVAIIEDRPWRRMENAWVILAYYVLKYRRDQKRQKEEK